MNHNFNQYVLKKIRSAELILCDMIAHAIAEAKRPASFLES